jgi:CO dehydrogenase nickel-insertion accessory protein CooC1
MQNNSETLSGKRIGIFGKGGAGKSTFCVLLARALQSCGVQVCVLDADSTNVGLERALGVTQPPKTLIEYFGGMVFSGGAVTCPVDDPTPLSGAEISMDELPSQYYRYNDDGVALLIAGKIGNQGPGAGCDGPIAKIARDLLLHQEEQEPVTLIDFKAGFEDSARGAVTKLDFAIVVVDPTTASVEIAANLQDMVGQIQADILPATAHLENPEMVALANRLFTESKIADIFFVLNKIPNAEIESYLREKLLTKGIEPLGVIHDDPTVKISWLKGKPIHAEVVTGEINLILDKLVERANGSS